MNDMPSALSGITVLDLSGGLAAALASMFLADNGARVIRPVSEESGASREPDIFALYDRGKEPVVFDPESDADGFRALLADADVLIEDLSPSSTLGSRLGSDGLAARNHRLVHCSITAYGKEGPLKDEPADHDLAAARIGILGSQPSWRGGPIHVAHPVAYVGAGLLAAMGVAATLYRRERTGRGGRVETSLMAGALLYSPKAAGDSIPVRPMNMTPQGGGPFYSVFECADGEWLQLGCIHSGFVDIASAVIGVADTIASSPEYGDGRWPRDEGARKRLFDLVADTLRTRPADEWIRELRAADVPCDLARTAEEAMRDPQILHNGLVRELDDPALGRVSAAGLPIKLSATPGRVRPRKTATPGVDALAPGAARSSDGEAPPEPGDGLPLSGVRVMEMTNVIAGPVAGRLLADLGADVVKFESPDGDISRPAGGAGFIAFNANKRGVSVNTRTEEGREIARRLAARSDAILANMRPGATDRMGLDSATLERLNPRLVQSHITAYGWDGPYCQRPGVDPIAQAITGLQRAQGGYGSPPVYLSALAPCDYTGGALGALGTILALVARERHGVAQRADTNLLAAGTIVCADGFMSYDGKKPRLLPGRDQMGVSEFRRLYRASDGWIYLASDAPESREALRLALSDLSGSAAEPDADYMESTFSRHTANAALDALRSRGVPCAPVTEGYQTGFFQDPQVEANTMRAELDHPVLGAVGYSGNLVSFGDVNSLPRRPTPLLGQHTDEVLAWLGYAPHEIDALRRAEVVRTEISE